MKFILLLLLINASIFPLDIGEDILPKSDKEFFPDMAIFKLRLENFEKDKYDKYFEIKCYVKGCRKYLAVFKKPAIMKRNSHLRLEDNIWIHFGKINRTKKISAKASFEGSTFSEEDILSTSLAYYYKLEKSEEIEENGEMLIKLTLKAKSKKSAYSKIESYIKKLDYLPIKRYYYSFSDQKIKEMKVDEIIKKEGKTNYIKLTMYDLLITGNYTIVEMSDFEIPSSLSDRIFTKKYMELASE